MQFQMLGYHSLKTRVRFGQTDRYGYTWHGHLPVFLEEGRADFARRYGLGTDTLLRHKLSVPMIELAVEYCHVSYEDEVLDVQLTLLRPLLKLPVLVFVYRIFGGPSGETEIARGRTRQALLSGEGIPIVRIPGAISELLDTAFRSLEDAPRWRDPKAITSSRTLMGDQVVCDDAPALPAQLKESAVHESRA